MNDTCWRLAGLPRLVILSGLVACDPGANSGSEKPGGVQFEVAAMVKVPALGEISGLETIAGPLFIVHNDDGPPQLFVLDANAKVQSRVHLKGAKNRDWEDITWVALTGEQLLAVGDIGDNLGRRETIQVYFVEGTNLGSRTPGSGERKIEVRHTAHLRYPDGPRDCEAMAFDSSSGRILFLSKRDHPPRLYGIDAVLALEAESLELEFLGTAPTLRPPTRQDMNRLGKDGAWVSQPTGMDINEDGTLAAIITYRSLYLYQRAAGESWADALQKMPREFLGPRSRGEEAIAFDPDMKALYITTEGLPAPLYRTALPPPRESQDP